MKQESTPLQLGIAVICPTVNFPIHKDKTAVQKSFEKILKAMQNPLPNANIDQRSLSALENIVAITLRK